jgi:NAD(P)-dependent dehydrogenase (short-subunit alcohol dehydrogenase family)
METATDSNMEKDAAQSMGEKICLVTGANSGIGRATALGLAQRGATVLMVARNRARGEEAQAAIRAQSGNDAVRLYLTDLANQVEIRDLAAAVLADYAHLHVLVNNAGIMLWRRQETAAGYEKQLAVNHLAYFLLTNLLLSRLQASGTPQDPARIVNVASDAHRAARRADLDDLQSKQAYGPMRAYSKTKLMNIMFTFELARRLEATYGAARAVTVNAVHPGGVATNLWSVPSALQWLVKPLVGLFLRSPEEGAETPLYLATSPAVAGVNGAYFADKNEIRAIDLAYDRELAAQLWTRSAALTGLEANVVDVS